MERGRRETGLRRERLHHLLEGYGHPVQYSVFECRLRRRDLDRLQARVRRIIRPALDQVRYYFLCAACVRRTEVQGRGAACAGADEEAIVVG